MTIAETLSSIFAIPDRRPTPDWLEDNVNLFPPITRPGKFKCGESRHFITIFGALDDERTREVNVLKPVRGGGSLIGDGHVYSTIKRNPGPTMCVYQTDPDAKMHFFDRLEKSLRGSEVFVGLLPDRYDPAAIFLNSGHTLYVGGPGISNLQSKPVRY